VNIGVCFVVLPTLQAPGRAPMFQANYYHLGVIDRQLPRGSGIPVSESARRI
jgi:hypothetical protein